MDKILTMWSRSKKVLIASFALIIVLTALCVALYIRNTRTTTSFHDLDTKNQAEMMLMQSQLNSFQRYFTADTPREIVDIWAKGVKNRNGAVQYTVLSPDLQAKVLPKFTASGWDTGTSSPWVRSILIREMGKEGDSYTYKATVTMATSNDSQETQLRVSVQQNAGKWCITSITTSDGQSYY